MCVSYLTYKHIFVFVGACACKHTLMQTGPHLRVERALQGQLLGLFRKRTLQAYRAFFEKKTGKKK